MSRRQTIQNKKVNIIYLIYAASGKHEGYIGKTHHCLSHTWEKYCDSHVRKAKRDECKKRHFYNWLRKIEYRVKNKILEVVATDKSWKKAERYWIKYYKEVLKWKLKNSSDGGDGLSNPTKKVRENISRAQLKWNKEHPGARVGLVSGKNHPMWKKFGKDNPNFGSHGTKAQKKNIARGTQKWIDAHPGATAGKKNGMFGKPGVFLGKRGKDHPCYGRKRSKAEIKKTSGKNNGMFGKPAWNRGRHLSREDRKKKSMAMMGKNKGKIHWNKGKHGLQTPWNKGKKT